MKEFLHYQNVITAIVLGLVLAGAAALYFLLPKDWSWGAGLLWGGACGLLVLRMKVLAIIRFAQDPQKAPVKGGFAHILPAVVFLLLAVFANRFLGGKVGHDVLNLWMALAGIFLPNAVLMADGLLRPAAALPAGGETPAPATRPDEKPADGADDDENDGYKDF